MKGMPNRLRIGTRASALALWQAEYVAGRLRAIHPGLEVELIKISTKGDKITDTALSRIGGKGLFTKELEQALLDGEIDLCVHSMKDVPTQLPMLPETLAIVAMCERADVRDAVVLSPALSSCGPTPSSIFDLPAGTVVGTSALRRQAQLKAQRPDLEYRDLRGNLDTRLAKVAAGEYGAAVLAAAGIQRMGWQDQVAFYLPTDQVLPACGQGAIGIEARLFDDATCDLLTPLDDAATRRAVEAERLVMDRLDGGCQTPFAAYARFEADRFRLDALVASVDGSRVLRAHDEGPVHMVHEYDDAEVAFQVSHSLITQGAPALMEEARQA
jgi:hydroxymethylbilane synthase